MDTGKGRTTGNIRSVKDLRVYQMAFRSAMEVYQLTRTFPKEELFSMVSQMTRSSRSVCANLAEAWRKRRYQAAFVAKLNDAESEACEMQVWMDFAKECGYVDSETAERLNKEYDRIESQLVTMVQQSEKWLIRG
jgi:four helix bundle protein